MLKWHLKKGLPWLRRLIAHVSPPKSEFDPRPVHVGFMVNKVALVQGFLRVLRFHTVICQLLAVSLRNEL
jgi:hypothetical protein